jgi:hypothetical protein
VLESWVRGQEGRFSVSKAVATSIAFVGYNFDMPSAELANHIREKASVLVAPGGYLGTENHLRITVGYEPEKVRTALERIGSVAAELVGASHAAAALDLDNPYHRGHRKHGERRGLGRGSKPESRSGAWP